MIPYPVQSQYSEGTLVLVGKDYEHYVQRHEKVLETPSRNRTFNIPDVLSEHLDDLVARLTEDGYLAKRAEIVGALIAHAPTDSKEMYKRLQAYRAMVVEDILIDPEGESVFIRPPSKGPRPRG